MITSLRRAALFVLVGAAVFAHWFVTSPTHDQDTMQTGWWYVLAFSGMIVLIGIGVVVFARLTTGKARRAPVTAAAGAAIAGGANILEDGLAMGWAFFATIVGTGVLLLGLLATAATTALALPGRRRMALVPLGTALAIVLYVEVGGPLMLATWSLAAAFALQASRGLEAVDQPGE